MEWWHPGIGFICFGGSGAFSIMSSTCLVASKTTQYTIKCHKNKSSEKPCICKNS